MKLRIKQREREGIVILDLHGPLVRGEPGLDLRNCVRALRRIGKVRIALNLEDVGKYRQHRLGNAGRGPGEAAEGRGTLGVIQPEPLAPGPAAADQLGHGV